MSKKEHKTIQLSDLTPCVDGRFVDSYGNVVKHGSRIIIESTYGGYNGGSGEALVEWDEKQGMYKYIRVDDWLKSRYNFYGIHKFKIIENDKENENEQIQITKDKAVS